MSVAQADDVTVLYNAFGKPSGLTKDWRFSALLEVDGKRICSTPATTPISSRTTLRPKASISPTFAVISHRHGDHIGGLSHLLSVNPKVKIYAPMEGVRRVRLYLAGDFYPPNESLRFGTAWPDGNFTLVGEATEVAPGFHVIALPGDWGADPPVMELSLAIDTPKGIVLVVGCSHPTIEKIVKAATAAIDKPIHLVVGGTHLLPADEEEIQRIASALHDTWKVNWIAPAHCTGEPTFEIVQEIFGDRIRLRALTYTCGAPFTMPRIYKPIARSALQNPYTGIMEPIARPDDGLTVGAYVQTLE